MPKLIHDFLREAHPRRFFLETWRRMDDECRTSASASGTSFDWRPMLVAIVVSASMLLVFSIGKPEQFPRVLSALGITNHWTQSPWSGLAGYLWWSCLCVLLYLVFPALVIVAVWKRKLSEFGLATSSLRPHWGIAILAFIAMVPCILVATTQNTVFLAYYPMYPDAHRSWADLLLWEFIYLAQFLAIEFFFRGFAINALRTSMGSQAIFVATIPYAIAHIAKPLPEALGAIAVGIFLGTLAVRTRAIWSGFLIHASVAVSMDAAAIVAKNQIPGYWWPAD